MLETNFKHTTCDQKHRWMLKLNKIITVKDTLPWVPFKTVPRFKNARPTFPLPFRAVLEPSSPGVFSWGALMSYIDSKCFPSWSFWLEGRAGSHTGPDPVSTRDEDAAPRTYKLPSCWTTLSSTSSHCTFGHLLKPLTKEDSRTDLDQPLHGHLPEDKMSPQLHRASVFRTRTLCYLDTHREEYLNPISNIHGSLQQRSARKCKSKLQKHRC